MSTTQGIQKALEILGHHRDLVNRIQLADPYPDKRFAPTIANWVVKHDITPEEHAEDIVRFKLLRKRLKDLRIPAANTERKRLVKELLFKGPEDFAHHYSALQEWNRAASDILDPQKDLSDKGLPVVMRHNGYTMYRIDKKKHLLVPLVRNAMGWCVTKQYFGQYGGPPYYPIVRDQDREPFCMVIPALFDKNPDQAVRNANNDGRISPRDLRLIRPLVQRVLPMNRHTHPYIRGVHDIRDGLSKYTTPKGAFRLMVDLALCPGEWPDGEQIISQDPEWAFRYANDVIKGPFPKGEPAISRDPKWALFYVRDVLKAPWPAGEPSIATESNWAYFYAQDVLKGPFPPGEYAIATSAELSFDYAGNILKRPFPAGEPAIATNPLRAFRYAVDILKGPFPLGEPAIAKNSDYAFSYARNVLRGPFPQGEPAIASDQRDYAFYAFSYARNVLKGPFPAGEPVISRDADLALRYAREVLKAPFPLGEKIINSHPELACVYANDVLKPFYSKAQEAEKGTMKEAIRKTGKREEK